MAPRGPKRLLRPVSTFVGSKVEIIVDHGWGPGRGKFSGCPPGDKHPRTLGDGNFVLVVPLTGDGKF